MDIHRKNNRDDTFILAILQLLTTLQAVFISSPYEYCVIFYLLISLMTWYSHSQIHTHLTCPLKRKFDKIDGLGKTTKESSLTLILGTAVHAALEFLYKQRSNLRTPLQEQVIQVYTMTFSKECSESSTVFLDDEKATFFERWSIYLDRYRSTYYPFDQAITMAVEESLSFKMNDQISFSGYIDRIDVTGNTLTIIDYKTSKKLEADDSDTHKQQITLYAAGLQQKYGSKFDSYCWTIVYLHLQKEVRRIISNEDIENISSRYLNEAMQMQQKRQDYSITGNQELFEAKVGYHCDYCPFKMLCPQWKHEYMDDSIESTELWEKTIKSLVDDYAVLQKKIGELSKEKETISKILVDYATTKELPVLFGNERKTSIQSRMYRSVKADHERDLRRYCKEHDLVDSLIKTDTNALAKLISEKQIDLDHITPRVIAKTSERLWVASKK